MHIQHHTGTLTVLERWSSAAPSCTDSHCRCCRFDEAVSLARKHAAPSRECPTGLHWPWWVQAQAAFLKGDLAQVSFLCLPVTLSALFFPLLCLWAMAYGHSSGLPPWEAPVIIAEKRKLFFSFSFLPLLCIIIHLACYEPQHQQQTPLHL